MKVALVDFPSSLLRYCVGDSQVEILGMSQAWVGDGGGRDCDGSSKAVRG